MNSLTMRRLAGIAAVGALTLVACQSGPQLKPGDELTGSGFIGKKCITHPDGTTETTTGGGVDLRIGPVKEVKPKEETVPKKRRLRVFIDHGGSTVQYWTDQSGAGYYVFPENPNFPGSIHWCS